MRNRFKEAIDLAGWPDRGFGPCNGRGVLNTIKETLDDMAASHDFLAEAPEQDPAVRLMVWWLPENLCYVRGSWAPGWTAGRPALRWQVEQCLARMDTIRGTDEQHRDWVVRCHVAAMAQLCNTDEISDTYSHKQSVWQQLGAACAAMAGVA